MSKIIRLESVGSTSDYAKEIAAEAQEGTVVIAQEQTLGRGKPGSVWFSPKGSGLYFSVILKPKQTPNELAGLTLMAAQAVVNTLNNLYGLEASIKLPNDVMLSQKKACGILTEKIKHALIAGIGVNVNTKDFPQELNATSVALELGYDVDREQLFQTLLNTLNKEYLKFLSHGI